MSDFIGRWELIAAALSAHTGVKIRSEREAEKVIQNDEYCKNCGSADCNGRFLLDMRDIFYGQNREVSSNDINLNFPDEPERPQKQSFTLDRNLLSKPSTNWGQTGLHAVYYIKDEDLAPRFDCDFTKLSPDGQQCIRGTYAYSRPYGYDRAALKVVGKYEDDIWLGEKGWRSHASPEEWAVAYHGTGMDNIRSIAGDGYDLRNCKRDKFGEGIYSTPSIQVAEAYGKKFQFNGKQYKVVLQNRVNLANTKEVPSSKTLAGAPYFVTPNESDIRPYGVCIKCLDGGHQPTIKKPTTPRLPRTQSSGNSAGKYQSSSSGSTRAGGQNISIPSKADSSCAIL